MAEQNIMERYVIMRKRLFEIIEVGRNGDKASNIYDIFMMICIAVSLIPLMTRSNSTVMQWIDWITVSVFIIDYLLRLCTADIKLNKGIVSFFLYPFTFLAVIDLLSILPTFNILSKGLKGLRAVRLVRAFRLLKILKVFKSFRYSKNITIIMNVLRKQRDSLLVVLFLAVGYIFVTALIMFNVEPETFETFFDSVYWATVSLTTVGYGDVYAVSSFGKLLTMVSALFGIAIVALPAGIITAGYMEEVSRIKSAEDIEK